MNMLLRSIPFITIKNRLSIEHNIPLDLAEFILFTCFLHFIHAVNDSGDPLEDEAKRYVAIHGMLAQMKLLAGVVGIDDIKVVNAMTEAWEAMTPLMRNYKPTREGIVRRKP